MAELRYTYLLDVRDRASRPLAAANERIAKSATVANRALEKQSAVAQSSAQKITRAGARQSAEWRQVARAAQTAERQVARSSTEAATAVSRATARQVAAQRRAGASYAQIARQQKAAGVSARQTAAAIEQSAARERRAVEQTAVASSRSRGRIGQGLKQQVRDVKGLATGLVAGFGVLKGAQFIGDSVKQVTDLARATAKLQGITKQDATTASAWVQIAKERGLSTRQLNQAFITMEKAQVKGAAGTKTQAEAFAKLGISQEQLKRSSPQQLIERVSDGFKRLGPGAQRAAVASALFGRGAQALLGPLGRGSKGLKELIEQFRKSGATMDENGVRKTFKFIEAQRALDRQMAGLKVTIGTALLPALTAGAKWLGTFIQQMRNGTGPGGAFARALKTAADGAKSVWTAIQPAVKALASFVRQHPGIVKVAGGIVAVGLAVKALRFAGAISGVNSLLKVLGVLSRTKAGSLAARAIVGALSPLGKMLAGPLATAKRVLVNTLAGAGEDAGAAAVGGIRGKLSRMRLPRPTGLFRAFGTAMGIAAGAALVGQISKALDNLAFGNNKTRRSGGGSSGSSKIDDLLPLGDVTHAIQNFLGLRHGGVVGYQAGGVVPAMVSPGEMIVHQGRAGMVPGHPVAADSVAMMLPVGAAVITRHGQGLMAQGASVSEAVARQAPHFQTGGHVRGRLSWFGGPHDSQDSGKTALGLTTATPGVAVRPGATWQTGRATLGAYWRIRTPNGRSAVLRQTDLGPNQSTGRRIDLTYSALGRLGYNEGNFPTDRVGVADLVGGGAATRPAAGSSYRLSGYAAALARRVGPSRIRSGILPDAFDQGVAQGEAGMTRARLRVMGDPVYRAISAAYRVPGDKIVRVAGRPGGTGGSRPLAGRHAWRGVGQAGLGGRIVDIAGRVMGAFPGLQVTSTTGGRHAKNSWHYKGRAVDLAGGNMNAAAQWVWRNVHRSLIEGIHNPNLSVAGGRGVPASYWGPTTWGQHANHIHLAARRGGVVPRFQAGGRVPRYTYATPGERGRVIRGDEFGVYGQPSRGFGSTLGGAMFPVVRASNEAFKRRFAALNAAIQNAALDKLAALRRGLTGAVRRGGSELAVKRMQQAIDLVDRELGRRIGLLSRRIAARAAAADTRVARTDIGLRIRGMDPDSPQGITERLGAERFRGDALHRTGRDLAKQLRLAEKGRNLAKVTEIRQEIADNQTAILDSRANQAELGRARADAEKAARLAFAQGLTDVAASRTGLAQSGLQTLELRQRLAGTYDQGGQARADYIRSQIVPDLQAEQAGIRAQEAEAMRQNNADLARELARAYADKQNEILQAQLDAQEATAQNTEQTADAIKSLGGTLGFEFGGSRLTDALLASGVGA